VLRNTTLGVDKASLKFDVVGNISITGTTITLNSGILGVARLTDPALSTIVVDPKYWLFINAIQAFFTSISVLTGPASVTQSQLGALGQAFLALVPLAPASLTSKISAASTTVTAG